MTKETTDAAADSDERVMSLRCRESKWGGITPDEDITVIGLRLEPVEPMGRIHDQDVSVRLYNGCTGEWVAAPLWKWQRGLNPNMRVKARQDVNVEVGGAACRVLLVLGPVSTQSPFGCSLSGDGSGSVEAETSERAP